MEVSKSLIGKICGAVSDGIHFATPISSLRTTEVELVRGVLRMLQGLSSSLLYWDNAGQRFCVKRGIYVSHLSLMSLHVLLNQFIYSATCLQLVEVAVKKVEASARSAPPTLRAFASSVSAWLSRLRDIALKEELKMSDSSISMTPTLLGLANSLSSLCSGAEFLFQIVHGAIPQLYFEPNSMITAAEISLHLLDHLYYKLDEVCLVQGGEEEVYQMLLHIFVGSLLPYIEILDSWLFEGTLDDPFEEMFFYGNSTISVDEPDFWEKSYQLRLVQHQELDADRSVLIGISDHVTSTNDKKDTVVRESVSISNTVKGKDQNSRDLQACPVFIKDMAKSIVSAGKSLQLIRHVPVTSSALYRNSSDNDMNHPGRFNIGDDLINTHRGQSIGGLTLSEISCVSLVGLIGHGDHISGYFLRDNLCKTNVVRNSLSGLNLRNLKSGSSDTCTPLMFSEKIWDKFMVDTSSQKGVTNLESANQYKSTCFDTKQEYVIADYGDELLQHKSFCSENPILTVCRMLLMRNRNSWRTLNLSGNSNLPPLNDGALLKAVFGWEQGPSSAVKGTNYALGFRFSESEHLRMQSDTKLLEVLFPFPTLLPSFQDDNRMSELMPFQNNSTLASRVLIWIQNVEPRTTTLPAVIVQECLTAYLKKQVDYIGRLILSKLMNDWKLMEELAVLRAIYLLGSGDLLQHFLTVIFNKLDKGETWDDDFELNTILQESIRNSADEMLLSAPDSLVVSITKNNAFDGDEQPIMGTLSTPRKIRAQSFGIDGLDSLKFTYKVSWPLELIANSEAIKKYNQVMGFLLRVKRAKFVLDKARRWMWKGRGTASSGHKHHWLVEQKLLHFVDAFHQYVMDRVYHSAWRELCDGMAAAGSLDEVIDVHEAYLLSIQRQCFVVPDKLWALIASRINSILGLALEFYSIQQTLSSSGTVSAIKARCEMEVDRIEKQFDDCIAFLLRVLSFKLNVGHFPHLADLVTRINYNYFYMSDSGNLMTASGSETVASRLGKAFAAKAKHTD